MLLQPRKSKYNKSQKGKLINKVVSNTSSCQLQFGTIGLKSISYGQISGRQLETFYNALNKFIKRNGQIKFHIFPQIPVSKKPNEIRMGKGKGSVSYWSCKIKPGTLICEIAANDVKKIHRAIKYALVRMPLKIKVVYL